MDWIDLAQGRDRWRAFLNAIVNLLVPSNGGNFVTGSKPVSFSRSTLLHGVGVRDSSHRKMAQDLK